VGAGPRGGSLQVPVLPEPLLDEPLEEPLEASSPVPESSPVLPLELPVLLPLPLPLELPLPLPLLLPLDDPLLSPLDDPLLSPLDEEPEPLPVPSP
jgi:hypothetical protein